MADAIRRYDGPEGVWLETPPRTAPAAMAWGMAVMGVFITGFMLFWMTGASGGWRYRGPGDLIPIVFGLLGLPGLGIGLLMIAMGLGLRRGWSRCCICVGRERVLVRERLGVLRWTRAARRADVAAVLPSTGGQGMAGLLLRLRGRRDVRCAVGHTQEVVRALAEALGALLEVRLPDGRTPPPGHLHVEESGRRLAVSLRTNGGWGFLAVFTLFWLAFVGAFTAAALGLVGGKPLSWAMAAFTLPFWAVGIGLGGLCVHLATQRVSLLWDGAELTLVDVSAWRRRIRRWSAADLRDILVEERGSGSGRHRVIVVSQRDGGAHELGQGLDDECLAWIAERLRQDLQVSDACR